MQEVAGSSPAATTMESLNPHSPLRPAFAMCDCKTCPPAPFRIDSGVGKQSQGGFIVFRS